MFKKLIILLLLVSMAVSVFAGGNEDKGRPLKGLKKYTIFLGYEKENYPTKGTIFGNWLEEQTGVYIEWEILVGDLDQKVGILAAAGDYPDAVAARNRTNVMYEAGAFIPLNDLLEQYGQDILKLWGDQIVTIKRDDGEVYWMPQQMPWGEKTRSTQEAHGFYIQAAVLKENGWPMPANVTEAMNMLCDYAEKHPEINGNKTYAFTALNDGWREYCLVNAPSVFSGHPNDGKAHVDWVDGKWVASPIGFSDKAYKIYKIYNDVYLRGYYDTESFVMSFDQYTAKLTTGSILGFYDQWWNFTQPQKLLKNQAEYRWYVPMPIVMEGYPEAFEGPVSGQSTEGIGITVDCSDPEGLMKYFNFLAKEDTMLKRCWGFEGTDYLVDDDGMFYRTQEMVDRWENIDWRNQTYGADYWVNMLYPTAQSLFPDGINSVGAGNQPSVYQQKITPQEVEVLKAYNLGTFTDWFNTPDPRRALYFAAWEFEYPTGSDVAITDEQIMDIRRKYTPLLITAEPGQYDAIWDEYIAKYEEIPKAERDAVMEWLQAQIDNRIVQRGGYW